MQGRLRSGRPGGKDSGLEPLLLSDVVQAIGSDGFGPCLAATMHRELAIDQVMVFRTAAGLPAWQTLVAQNVHDGQLASRLARAYTGHFWSRDPNRRRLASVPLREAAVHAATDLHAADAEYRRALFLEPRLVDKAAIILRAPEGTLYLNFYRGGAHGAFTGAELERLRLTRDFLAAVVERHFAVVERSQECSLGQLLQVFGRPLPPRSARLSEREAQTCARIVLGYSSEAISLDLGVSLHSAATYRRRAFAKLGIATQQVLFGIVLRHRRHLDH